MNKNGTQLYSELLYWVLVDGSPCEASSLVSRHHHSEGTCASVEQDVAHLDPPQRDQAKCLRYRLY